MNGSTVQSYLKPITQRPRSSATGTFLVSATPRGSSVTTSPTTNSSFWNSRVPRTTPMQNFLSAARSQAQMQTRAPSIAPIRSLYNRAMSQPVQYTADGDRLVGQRYVTPFFDIQRTESQWSSRNDPEWLRSLMGGWRFSFK